MLCGLGNICKKMLLQWTMHIVLCITTVFTSDLTEFEIIWTWTHHTNSKFLCWGISKTMLTDCHVWMYHKHISQLHIGLLALWMKQGINWSDLSIKWHVIPGEGLTYKYIPVHSHLFHFNMKYFIIQYVCMYVYITNMILILHGPATWKYNPEHGYSSTSILSYLTIYRLFITPQFISQSIELPIYRITRIKNYCCTLNHVFFSFLTQSSCIW